MPPQKIKTDYEPIDTDPHFTRVVRYFRNSDYLVWAATTAFGPAFYYLLEKGGRVPTPNLGFGLKLSACVGAAGGFLLAYQRSSMRFWGWTENAQEYERDLKEMRQRIKEGKPLYGVSRMNEYAQMSSSWMSRYAALRFSAFPIFNFVNHNNHGVDTSRYYKDLENDEEKEEKF
ncbi:7893_t:CDS:2 [Dentiscutata heterogama]|uniref:7893_t:CDS:1 n=1 Tax=Dentiscutata heterogama TaxID=1316150 RepID=A0ACA9KPG0_9GLOM|nr:7893_t:CDS:2 [Dentiscutata heterogama]